MFDNPQQQNEPFPDKRAMAGWLVFLARVGAVTLEVFLHKDFGSRYFGLQAFAACFLILFWSLGWEGYDVKELVWFLGAYLLMLFAARLRMGWRLLRGGPALHSYYSGTPHLLTLVPRIGESVIKRLLEPSLAFAVGLCVRDFSRPLGTYLMFAAACLFVSCGIDALWERANAANLHDAVLEQEALIGRFRHLRRR